MGTLTSWVREKRFDIMRGLRHHKYQEYANAFYDGGNPFEVVAKAQEEIRIIRESLFKQEDRWIPTVYDNINGRTISFSIKYEPSESYKGYRIKLNDDDEYNKAFEAAKFRCTLFRESAEKRYDEIYSASLNANKKENELLREEVLELIDFRLSDTEYRNYYSVENSNSYNNI